MQEARKLLVVEDDPSVREMLVTLGKRLGYQVQAVASGEEGLTAFKNGKPSLAVLDVVLPGLDGLETLKLVKAIKVRDFGISKHYDTDSSQEEDPLTKTSMILGTPHDMAR